MLERTIKHLLLGIFAAITTCCLGQTDTVLRDTAPLKDSISAFPTDNISVLPKDSMADSPTDSAVVVKEKKHSPKLAGWLSAALPGLGQAYNKKYWKIPIDYAGFAATGYCVYYFSGEYIKYRDEYRNRLNKKPPAVDSTSSLESIYRNKQDQQQNMQLSIIVLAVWYFVNILDAVVDAHLMSFDVSHNLAMQITPDFNINSAFAKQTVGLSFTFNIKGSNCKTSNQTKIFKK